MSRRRAGAAALVVAVVLAAAALLSPPGLQAIGDFLVVEDALVPADAVIAISGDGTGERVATAVDLVRRGYGRWLILSGSRAGAAAAGATAAMVQAALRGGIPEERLLVDDASASTEDNARHSAVLMADQRLHSAILVTSPYHTRRAAVIFRREFRRRGLELRVVPAQRSFFDVRGWWTRRPERALVIREYAKLVGAILGID